MSISATAGTIEPLGTGRLWAGSPAMRRVLAQLGPIGAADTTVVIEGENATDRAAIAEAVHVESARRARPFVVIDCARPAAELASELFGDEPAADGAPRPSAFEAAAGGTLFLDAIDALPGDLQAALVCALERRSLSRSGAPDLVIDARVIAATDRDLSTEVATGRFRADLLDYLAVAVVRVPRPDEAFATPATDAVIRYAEARQQALAQFERDYVSQLLIAAGGCVSAAARLAGLDRTYVHRLISRHRLGRAR